MGNRTCPSCKKSILIHNSKTSATRIRRCKKCGYKEKVSYVTGLTKEKIQLTKEGVPKLTSKDLPELKEEIPVKKQIRGQMDDKGIEDLLFKEALMRKERKRSSHEKIMKKIRKNKYGIKKGTKINIEGELYTV